MLSSSARSRSEGRRQASIGGDQSGTIDAPRWLRGLLLGRIRQQMREAMKIDTKSVRDGLPRE
jgi:hypothetical protein